MNNISEFQACQVIATALGLPQAHNGSFQALCQLEDMSMRGDQPRPFALNQCQVVYQKVELLPLILFPARRNRGLLAYFDEVAEETPLIVFDSQLAGKDAVFIVRSAQSLEQLSDIAALYSRNCPWSISGPVGDRFVTAYRLKDFAR